MKKSLSIAYGLSKRSRPGSKLAAGSVKKAISPISDGGRLVDILMDRKKMAQGGEVDAMGEGDEEGASGEDLEQLNEDAVDESTDEDGEANTDVISNEIGDESEKEKEDESLSARARRKMKSRK